MREKDPTAKIKLKGSTFNPKVGKIIYDLTLEIPTTLLAIALVGTKAPRTAVMNVADYMAERMSE